MKVLPINSFGQQIRLLGKRNVTYVMQIKYIPSFNLRTCYNVGYFNVLVLKCDTNNILLGISPAFV